MRKRSIIFWSRSGSDSSDVFTRKYCKIGLYVTFLIEFHISFSEITHNVFRIKDALQLFGKFRG